MKALKTRRRCVAPSPVVPRLQIELGGVWRRYSYLLSYVCDVQELVIIPVDDHGALVRLVELLMRQQLYPVMHMLELD
jgi:hypothetical protein